MHSYTLTQFLIHHLSDHADQRGLILIMADIATIGKKLSAAIRHAGMTDLYGATGHTNVQQEQVQKLDVYANELCKNFLKMTGHFAAMASEEEEGIVLMDAYGKDAPYIICFDPLDGSSNIDVNISVGTIFSVYTRRADVALDDPAQFFQKGSEQVLAGYVLYGSSTVLVFSFGNGVYECTLDTSIGDFIMTREQMMIPEKLTMYSINEAHIAKMTPKDSNFTRYIQSEPGITARYVGSLVADVHRNMLKGGVFMYPALKDDLGAYTPKLRLLFEANPMAYLHAHMGGFALADKEAILDIEPTQLHQRVPLVIGLKHIVEKYLNDN